MNLFKRATLAILATMGLASAAVAAPSFSISDASARENAGSIYFHITKTGTSTSPSTVTVKTASRTATANNDYVPISVSVTFQPTETSKTVAVKVIDDTVAEQAETFAALLYAGTNATISRATAVGTIYDNETPVLNVTSTAVNETAGTATIYILRYGDRNIAVTYNWSEHDGTAKAGVNYTKVNGKGSFAAGQYAASLTVPILHDNVFTGDLAFTLGTYNVVGGKIGSSGTITLHNTDTQPVVTWTKCASEGSTCYVVGTANVRYGSGSTWTASKAVTGSIACDNATWGDPLVGTGKECDTDGQVGTPPAPPAVAPTINVASTAVNENASSVVVHITRTGDLTGQSVYQYMTMDGTAKAGVNYTALSGSATFPVGVNDMTLTIPVLDDNAYTGDLSFTFMVSATSNASVGQNGTITIHNTDAAPITTQTCPDGSVIPSTQTCPTTTVTPTQKCSDGSVVHGGSVCPAITSWVPAPITVGGFFCNAVQENTQNIGPCGSSTVFRVTGTTQGSQNQVIYTAVFYQDASGQFPANDTYHSNVTSVWSADQMKGIAPAAMVSAIATPTVLRDWQNNLTNVQQCPDEGILYTSDTCGTLTPHALPVPSNGAYWTLAPTSSWNGIRAGGYVLATQDCPSVYSSPGYTYIKFNGAQKGVVYKVIAWGNSVLAGGDGNEWTLDNPSGAHAINVPQTCLVGVQ